MIINLPKSLLDGFEQAAKSRGKKPNVNEKLGKWMLMRIRFNS